MKSVSVKTKVLFLIITLSVLSLVLFAWLSFSTYKKDKLAFVYDYIATETNAKSQYLSNTVDSYKLFLNTIISGMSTNASSLNNAQKSLIENNSNLQGIFYYRGAKNSDISSVLYESNLTQGLVSIDEIKNMNNGLTLIDDKKGVFIFKQPVGKLDAFAAVMFKQLELKNLFTSSQGRKAFVAGIYGHEPESYSHDIINRIEKLDRPFGLFKASVGEEEYFVSFSKVSFQDLVVVSLINESKVMVVQDMFVKQALLFLLLMSSASLLIGTLAASWLTGHLDRLTFAAKQFELEDFDHRVHVTSKDEIGVLGNAFNTMGEKTKSLLAELRLYNTKLEAMVEERTKELLKLTDIQNAMLNSLGQGFVTIDRDYKINEVYSKAAVDMFEVTPSQVSPLEILGIKEEESESFRELFSMAIDGMLDFDDMSKLHPELRTNSKNQKIFLTYAPIQNGETGNLDYVMVIGTDKTKELESLELSKKEWAFSQMIMKMASNRFSLIKVITESLNMLSQAMNAVNSDQPYVVRDVQRLIHTIKGSYSYFYISEVTVLAHDFETYLTPHYDSEKCSKELKSVLQEKIMAIELAIECYIDHFDSILQYRDSTSSKVVPVQKLDEFASQLKKTSFALYNEFKRSFYLTKIGSFFEMYPTIVKDLATKLNKEARFVLEGGDIDLPDGNWGEIFNQFIHIIRNSMDHGIESPSEREAAGKSREGKIRFKFSIKDSVLFVSLSDDGKGLDWTKIASKDSTVMSESDAIERIKWGGVSSKDEVSDISGRGVGVSAVFSVAKKLNLKAEMINNLGHGIEVVLEIPLEVDRLELLKTA